MNHIVHRRASIGLAINGPFSRNRRRRRSLKEAVPALIAGGLLLGLTLFFVALFS